MLFGCRTPMASRRQCRSAVGRLGRKRVFFPANLQKRDCCADEETAAAIIKSCAVQSMRSDPCRAVGYFDLGLVRLASLPSKCLQDQAKGDGGCNPGFAGGGQPQSRALSTHNSDAPGSHPLALRNVASSAKIQYGLAAIERAYEFRMIARLTPLCDSAAHCCFGKCTDALTCTMCLGVSTRGGCGLTPFHPARVALEPITLLASSFLSSPQVH